MIKPPVGVAVVGAGVISGQYLPNLARFPDLTTVALADIDPDRARTVAAMNDIPHSGDLASVLALPEVEIVLNLTTPAVHVEVDLAALAAGKHVYSEKPLALDVASARQVLSAADNAGLLVGCAPDTFLGDGLQAARRAVAAGMIGTPLAVAINFQTPGPESWHPNPEFLFQPGAGPLFDMGPYYLTALISMFGSVGRVAASARIGRPRRTIGSGPMAGSSFDVNTPTHVAALLKFVSGPAVTAVFTFDAARPQKGIEITGTDGVLQLPDPNTFGGPLRLWRPGDDDWVDLPVPVPGPGRGRGLLDLARAARTGGQPRASGELALHVVDVMSAVLEAADAGTVQEIDTRAPDVEPLPTGWDPTAAVLAGEGG